MDQERVKNFILFIHIAIDQNCLWSDTKAGELITISY